LGTSTFDIEGRRSLRAKQKYQSAREGFGAGFELGVDHVKRACE